MVAVGPKMQFNIRQQFHVEAGTVGDIVEAEHQKASRLVFKGCTHNGNCGNSVKVSGPQLSRQKPSHCGIVVEW